MTSVQQLSAEITGFRIEVHQLSDAGLATFRVVWADIEANHCFDSRTICLRAVPVCNVIIDYEHDLDLCVVAHVFQNILTEGDGAARAVDGVGQFFP